MNLRLPLLLALIWLNSTCALAADDWSGASWIWDSPTALEGADNEPVYFRYVLELPAAPQAAAISITADNAYELLVNAQKIGGDQEWQTTDAHDLTKVLRAGPNVIAIKATNSGGAAGCIAKVNVKLPAGKSLAVGTSAKWKTAAQAPAGWLAADFDDKAWKGASVIADASGGPWGLVARAGGSAGPTDRNVSDPKIKEYRPAAEELTQFSLPEKFKIELVAAEPVIINPVCLALDEKDRIYVSESHTYRFGPSGSPVKTPSNPIVRLDPLPDGKGYQRTLVAEGFDDPVMGMVIRDGQLWAAANNYLYRFDLTEQGLATNKQTVLVDKNKAWNPFGMFVLEWGPEGDLYMSVGNHDIDIGPPSQAKGEGLGGRGGSGIVMRMKHDGTQLERLVHGLRVPYSFDFDPFGQLWVLSNGEGNPNRFVRVIDGVDYHCYSRPQASNEWLAGRHPLAPPCFELPRGACTQLLRYYGDNFPPEYQGSLFLDNWGAHGFGGSNRTLFRYVPDERNNITTKEDFLVCRDPHFRCSHVLYAADGSLLIADWYGRDDESDLTGRIWRVSYDGKDRQPTASGDGSKGKEVLGALGALDHRARERAIHQLAKQGNPAIEALQSVASQGENPLAAASALWTLERIGTPESKAAIVAGTKHADWRVRRLAVQLLKRYQVPELEATARALASDKDPAVRVAAAGTLRDSTAQREALVAALLDGAALDAHLRYEAAAHLADVADEATLAKLLQSDQEELRLAGLITIDVASYERRAAAEAALHMLAQTLVTPGKVEPKWLLDLARMHDGPAIIVALRKLVAQPDADPAQTATALLLLRGKSAGAPLDEQAVKKFLTAVESGSVAIQSAGDWLTLLDLLSAEKPSTFAVQRISGAISQGDQRVREAGHRLARQWGHEAAAVAPLLWSKVLQTQNKNVQEKLEALGTLVVVEREPNVEHWTKLLASAEGPLLVDAIRSLRQYGEHDAMVKLLVERANSSSEKPLVLKGDLAAVVSGWPTADKIRQQLSLEALPESVDAYQSPALAAQPNAEAQLLGRRVFERTGCTKCHTTLSQNTERAPSLQNIGKSQKVEYLIESVIEPSKIIKTGFETETIVTKQGKVLAGLVKDSGDRLRVLSADGETTILKSDIEERVVQKKSLMPDGQHKLLSPREFADLIVYLRSL